MQVGLIGLGRMGSGMAKRLHAAGHEVVAFNRSMDKTTELADEGVVKAATSVDDLCQQLASPRVIYVMLPAGEVTEQTIMGDGGLVSLMTDGDIIIDGGNANYHDSVRRAARAQEQGIHYMDQGTSGGLIGATQGYCLMVGGDSADFALAEPLLQALAMPGGYAHVGPVGAGHFAKMVHNAIEYGMMESIAEGLDLLSSGPYAGYDYAKLLDLWQHGSIIQSFLVDVLQKEFTTDPKLEALSTTVSDNGEGKWAIEEALNYAVPFNAISAALFARYASRTRPGFAGKVLSAMRLGFGGHKK